MNHDNEIEVKQQDIQHEDDVDNKHEKDSEPQQIQAFDKLSVWQAAKMYRKIGLVCFLAAFSASLDGYQGRFNLSMSRRRHTLIIKDLSTARSSPTKGLSANLTPEQR